MQLDDINVAGSPLVLSPAAELDDAEEKLNITFPADYRKYVMRFGEGVLGGCYIRVYPPRRVIAELDEWRQLIDEHWFWDDGREVLTKQRALESVVIGDTLDGDQLIVHPSNSEKIYVLPRNSEDIYVAGDGLLPAIDWLCTSGTLNEAFSERDFEPFDSRAEA